MKNMKSHTHSFFTCFWHRSNQQHLQHTTITHTVSGVVLSPQDCDSNFQTQCQSHLQTANKMAEPAAFQVSIQQFRNAIVVN